MRSRLNLVKCAPHGVLKVSEFVLLDDDKNGVATVFVVAQGDVGCRGGRDVQRGRTRIQHGRQTAFLKGWSPEEEPAAT